MFTGGQRILELERELAFQREQNATLSRAANYAQSIAKQNATENFRLMAEIDVLRKTRGV